MKISKTSFLKFFLASLMLLALVTVAHSVSAQIREYTPLAPLPGITNDEANNLPAYLKGMFQLLIGVAAALAVIMMTIGGIQYMSTDAIGEKSEGKEKINNALKGLVLAISAWLILFTINPKLIELNFNPAPAGVTTGTTTPQTTPGITAIYKALECEIGGSSISARRMAVADTDGPGVFPVKPNDPEGVNAAQNACRTTLPIVTGRSLPRPSEGSTNSDCSGLYYTCSIIPPTP